ncbi:MAG: ABC transporter ATP-binding protein [Alphaproteobacteria bacterium]|nr:ABC transporter ATP-binding protein [Alphaproteobacteria bacterium]
MVDIRGLTKYFGPVKAVEGVTFSVKRGEVLGFLGPNGAGKSTTMKMLAGYLTPTSGSATVCGYDITRQTIDVQRRLGYLPEGAPAYGDLTPLGLMRFAAGLRGITGAKRDKLIQTSVERLELQSVLQRPIETLSKGFKRRVSLAQSILHDPEVLILDEPTDGLDPNQKFQVRNLLQQMAKNKAIIISTHILEEVDAVCSRVIIIGDGKVMADAQPGQLETRSAYHNAVVMRMPTADAEKAEKVLSGMAYVVKVERIGQWNGTAQLRALSAGGADILSTVHQAVSKAGVTLQQIHVEHGRLDDVFRKLTSKSRNKEA